MLHRATLQGGLEVAPIAVHFDTKIKEAQQMAMFRRQEEKTTATPAADA
jgi:hypothetical protein